jgi:hypothetical protein
MLRQLRLLTAIQVLVFVAALVAPAAALAAAPVCASEPLATLEDDPASASLHCADADGDALAYAIVSPPAHGVVTLDTATGAFVYTPAADYSGPDSFTFLASDATLASNTATISITVNPVNDAPMAVDDAATVAKNGSVPIFALANDSDVEGDTLTVISFTQPAHGTVIFSSTNNKFRYTPTKGFEGTDAFTYTIIDGQGGIATATVTITVR